jgi:hypothetical protein
MFDKKLITSIVASLFAAFPAQAAFDPFAGPKPIAVLIEPASQLGVTVSETPRLIIYDNGEIIFLKQSGSNASIHIIKLSQLELAQLEQKLAPLFEVVPARSFYNLTDATHQPITHLFLQKGDRQIALTADGLDCTGIHEKAEVGPADTLPSEFYAAHKVLCDFDSASSKPWTPKYIEAMLLDFSNAPGKSIKWPKDWPNLESDRAVQSDDMWSIFLDRTDLPKLSAFLKTQRKNGAVEIGRKKWEVSVRDTFPGEPIWMEALFEKQDSK